jgi:hypothetical protein
MNARLIQTVTSIDRMQVALLRFRRGMVIKTPPILQMKDARIPKTVNLLTKI